MSGGSQNGLSGTADILSLMPALWAAVVACLFARVIRRAVPLARCRLLLGRRRLVPRVISVVVGSASSATGGTLSKLARLQPINRVAIDHGGDGA